MLKKPYQIAAMKISIENEASKSRKRAKILHVATTRHAKVSMQAQFPIEHANRHARLPVPLTLLPLFLCHACTHDLQRGALKQKKSP